MQPPEWLWSAWENLAYSMTSWVLDIIENLISMFPEMPQNVEIIETGMYSLLSWVGHLIDVTAFSFMMTTIILYEMAMITVRVALWIWRLTPFGG